MNNITTFNFNGQEIRITKINEEPWFIAKDLCNALEVGNPSQALNRLDEDEKNTIILNDGTPGNPSIAIVSESGMYALVLTSRKPQARPFRKWVTSILLVELRKKGYYSTKEQPTMTQIQVLQAVVNQMAEQEQRQLALEREVSQQQQIINYQSQQLSGILTRQTEATRYLNSVERSPLAPPPKPIRAKIVELVKSYTASTSSDYKTVWNRLYREVYSRLGIDLKTRAKNATRQQNKKIGPLDIAEKLGILEDLFAIASDILDTTPIKQLPTNS